jgi:hypothetical protein
MKHSTPLKIRPVIIELQPYVLNVPALQVLVQMENNFIRLRNKYAYYNTLDFANACHRVHRLLNDVYEDLFNRLHPACR